MKGRAYLNKQDARAKIHLLNFVQKFNGQHFIKEAYQKLAWYELSMNNDVVAYKKYMSECLNKGKSLVDEDKQAEKEAKSGKVPFSFLLKARLYYDGGYYMQCLDVLLKNDNFLYKTPLVGWNIITGLAGYIRPRSIIQKPSIALNMRSIMAQHQTLILLPVPPCKWDSFMKANKNGHLHSIIFKSALILIRRIQNITSSKSQKRSSAGRIKIEINRPDKLFQ